MRIGVYACVFVCVCVCMCVCVCVSACVCIAAKPHPTNKKNDSMMSVQFTGLDGAQGMAQRYG